MALNFLKNIHISILRQQSNVALTCAYKYKVNNDNNSNNNFSTSSSGSGIFKITVRDVINKWKKLFLENNISEPKESIEYIVAHTLGTKKINDIHNYSKKYLSINEENKITEFCEQRLKNMPIQYIINEWDFRNLTLKMRPPVFIPRPETEQLVDLILRQLPNDATSTLLELCCGSGAISLSILNERSHVRVIAIDKLAKACNLTLENAKNYNLQSRLSIIELDLNNFDYNSLNANKFDIIVSNPPYILSEDMNTLQPEILLYEDNQALDGGTDGLNIIKLILNISTKLLNPNGKLFLELDPRQPAMIDNWLLDNPTLGLKLIKVHKDFCNKNRFIEILKF